ncbi:MAG: phosphoglucosamine mutase [Prolixibacteraceae bacterium]|jgi:phosphomannomutase|nr:phosphoglucosamine mutase [Bacteroidota bacterium]OQB80116.1 MAG: Phosphomannomutase/phosphoglucomutase [Bacteroidetes bacterium ADurb.Bin123]HNZ69847.1 phosphoglucosamine mutase [Prolixibacteraceae bacterium]HOC87833.1 phosphoglucosamine mutase [Prolixibacteraceae bacterium]HOF56108.1 phosphoglucosamine mutase [Prolixibacteraceae bacterium]
MTLIKSISGIRGTIGGEPGTSLTPPDVVRFTASYAKWLKESSGKERCMVVVGRDARISGEMVRALVCATLSGMGIDVVDIGLATTPTTEIAVTGEHADGGIIITASHNPEQWNALKLLNGKGEFLSAEEGAVILRYAEEGDFCFAEVHMLGSMIAKDYTAEHVRQVLALDLVDAEAICAARFSVAFDAVNSVGGIAIPALLEAMGVKNILAINGEPTGHFAHTPEPLPENLTETCEIVRSSNVDVCFVVDPDVDRLSIISEDGSLFNEEYTLVAVADYVLSRTPGNTVSNMSSSRALRVITEKYGGSHAASAVGEVHVVAKMKETGAVIGGEGNGGVIYPASHYGRDALVGIALFLTHLAKTGLKCSQLRKTYPDYFISKNKIELTPDIDMDLVLSRIEKIYEKEEVSTIDGVKIDFADEWVHLRKSNTEPIIRIYAESSTLQKAEKLASEIIALIRQNI